MVNFESTGQRLQTPFPQQGGLREPVERADGCAHQSGLKLRSAMSDSDGR